MYQEEAEFVGRLLQEGWIPPAEVKRYVKLAEDQSLPEQKRTYMRSKYGLGYREAQQDMLKANFRKVELGV